MSTALNHLLKANRLEQLDDNLFRGYDTWKATNRLFGGEVMSQSISAAQQTVADEFILHSFHAYFMRAGEAGKAVIYDVESIRDGRSFLSRRVTARQHGHAIYSCQCSFQPAEEGLSHQDETEIPPGPDGLITDQERYSSSPSKTLKIDNWPLEYRQAYPIDTEDSAKQEARNTIWIRANCEVTDDLNSHQQLLAFASDTHLLATSLRPHNINHWNSHSLRIATIDHSMWFHRPFRIDEWLMYQVNSPWAGNGRGLNFGRIYDTEGNLVASTAQEGMIRIKK